MTDREQQTGSPRPRRPSRGFIALLAILVVLALLAVAPFQLVRLAPVRERLLALGLVRAGSGERLRLTVARVARFTPVHLVLEGIDLEARDANGAWAEVTRADRLDISWSARDLLSGRLGVRSLTVDSLSVSLDRLALLSEPRGPQPSARRPFAAPRLPAITVHALALRGFALSDSAGPVARGDLALADLVLAQQSWSGSVVHGALEGPRARLFAEVDGGRLRLREASRLEIEDLRVASAGSRGRMSARADLADSTAALAIDLALDRLGETLLARVIPAAWPPAAGDSLTGTASLRLRPGRLEADVRLKGRLRGEALREASARVTVDTTGVRVRDLVLDAEVGAFEGDAAWDERGRSGEADVRWRGCDPASAWLPWLAEVPHGSARFDGRARVRLEAPSPTEIAVEGECEVSGAAPWSVATRVVRASGRLESARGARIEAFDARLPAGRVEAGGSLAWDGRECDLSVVIDGVEVGALAFARRAGLAGIVTGRAHMGGTIEDPVVEGEVHATQVTFGEVSAGDVSGERLLIWPLDLRGAGYVEARDIGGAGPLTGARVSVEFARWSAELIASAHVSHPEIEADLDLGVDPDEGSLRIERADLSGPRAGVWRLDRPFHLSRKADAWVSDSLVLSSDGTRLAAAVNWKGAGEGFSAGAFVRDLDLARLSTWFSGVDSLRGEAHVRVSAGGRWPDPRLECDLRCTEVGWGRLALGDCAAHAVWRDSALVAGPIELRGPSHEIRVPEIYLSAERPLAKIAGAPGLGDAPWTGRIEIARVDLGTFSGLLGLPVASIAGAGAPRPLDVGGRTVPLEIIVPWEERPAGEAEPLSGALRGNVVLEGTPRSPIVRLGAEVPDLRFARSPLGRLRVELAYRDSLVSVDRLDLSHEGRTTWGRGEYPFLLSFAPPTARPAGGAARLSAEIHELDLALVSALTRWVPDASGLLSGEVSIEGTGIAPRLSGALVLENGGLRIPERSERIHAITAHLTLGPEGLRIRSLEGRSGSQGTVSAVGTFRGPEDFDFSAVVERARVFEEGNYEFLASGDLNAFTARDPVTGRSRPHLNGTVEVLEGTLTQDLAARPPSGGPGTEVPWLIDLDVEVPGTIRLSQVNTKAEIGEGSLHVGFRWPYWNLSGTLQVLGGTYRLLNNVFDIRSGTVEFRDTGAGPDLTLDITAETRVTLVDQTDGVGEEVTVEVQVQGKPEELTVSLSSSPPLSEEEIVELLSVGRFSRTGRFEAASETQWIVLNTMVDRIESSLLAQSPLFSRVGIVAGSSGEEPLKVTLRPVVTPAFLVHYSQDLALDPERELSMNYRLSRGFYLRAGVARDRASSGAFSEEYSLDLRCRIEYE